LVVRRVNPSIFIFLLLVAFCSAGHASVIYRYTGEPFEILQDEPIPTGSFTTEMRVSGWIEMASVIPLFPVVIEREDVLGFSFHDGRTSYALDDETQLQLATLVEGTITNWIIEARTGAVETLGGQGGTMGTISIPGTAATDDAGILIECLRFENSRCGQFGVDQGIVRRSGSWELVPEPNTAGLLALGLTGLAITRRG
jgi:hypothetical protein